MAIERLEREVMKEEIRVSKGAKSLDLPFIIFILLNIGILIYVLGIRLGVREIIYFFIGVAVTIFFLIMFIYKPVYIAEDLSQLYPAVQNYVGNRWGKPYKEDGKTIIRVGIIPPRYVVFSHGSYEAPYVVETPWYDFLLGHFERVLEYGKFGPFRWAKKILFVPMVPEKVSYIELKIHSVDDAETGYVLGKFERAETEFSLIASLAMKGDYIFLAPATVEIDESGRKNIVFTAPPIMAKPKIKNATVDLKTMYSISSIVSRLSLTHYELIDEYQKRLIELVTTMRDFAVRDVKSLVLLSNLFTSAIRDIRIRETQKVAFESVLDRLTTALMTTDSAEVTREAVSSLLLQFYKTLARIEGGDSKDIHELLDKLNALIARLEKLEKAKEIETEGVPNAEESGKNAERKSP